MGNGVISLPFCIPSKSTPWNKLDQIPAFLNSRFQIRTLLIQRVPVMQWFKAVCLVHYFYRLHIASCAFIRGTTGPFHWRYNSTSFHWCLLVPLIGYKPLSGPWGTIVVRGNLLWNPTDFFCCSLLGSCILWGASIVISTDVSVDMSVVTRSTFYRYSTDTRTTSNQTSVTIDIRSI